MRIFLYEFVTGGGTLAADLPLGGSLLREGQAMVQALAEDFSAHEDTRVEVLRDARLDKLEQIFERIEQWTKTKTKFEVMEICNPQDIPVGPILSMKEIAEEPSLRETQTVVEVDHPERGPYLTVGMPVKLSDSPAEVQRSPLLGEHTEEILTQVLGYSADEIDQIRASGAIGDMKQAAE